MERESLAVADRDQAHSKWCGRGSRLLQLNLLRENLTTAELWCVHIAEGAAVPVVNCTVMPLPALQVANATFFSYYDWMVSIPGGKQQLLG